MGWSFRTDTNYDRAALMVDLQNPTRLSPGYVALEHRFVGNHHWYLMSTPEGRKIIGLDLMAGGGRGSEKMGWGCKGMIEESGPSQLDCPLSLLAMADAPVGYAIEWREQVVAYHARQKARAAVIKPGAKVVLNDKIFTLRESMGRKGWKVMSEEGYAYRMTTRTIARANLVAAS